ncbi:unnamed protein product (macronuclear) [Paramecium tetraurelia]|uniref:C2H2-type domain-containing protein n=1 Tax=Paramecium tetraurelia TaxID=5888 RepID=A0CTN3_PARTE|nr:uncharacterized protein GSPATT00010384001 [Paramecium tetraurelia]CAK74150.1 unnamed protein product [Paramecium tetraurelia]|eukprot:XP_001441547.1 hypothetical protein (macronuclear) [Paramecium tetraurelia strain d4-2]
MVAENKVAMNQFSEQCKQITGQQMQFIQNYYQFLVLNKKEKEKVEDNKDENKNNEETQQVKQQDEYMSSRTRNIGENDLVYNRLSEEIEQLDQQLIYDCQFCPKLFKNNVHLYWHTCQKHYEENQ